MEVVYDVVDTIGLYQSMDNAQCLEAITRLVAIGFEHLRHKNFDNARRYLRDANIIKDLLAKRREEDPCDSYSYNYRVMLINSLRDMLPFP